MAKTNCIQVIEYLMFRRQFRQKRFSELTYTYHPALPDIKAELCINGFLSFPPILAFRHQVLFQRRHQCRHHRVFQRQLRPVCQQQPPQGMRESMFSQTS